MKVRIEQLEALCQLEQLQKKPRADGADFNAVLAQELGQTGGTQESLPAAPPPGARAGLVSPLLMGGVEGVSATQATGERFPVGTAMERIDGLLDRWDAYAQELGKSAEQQGLRNAYQMLDGIDGDLQTLKQEMPDLAQQHAGLAAMMNELEVMTTTEKFKFNRGDYLA